MMSWDDVRAAADDGVEIGSHSATHPDLDVIPRSGLGREVADSRRNLEAGLGRPVRTFAYPHGYHSTAVVRAAEHAGYDSACAVGHGWSNVHDDRFALTLMFVFGRTTTDQLRAFLLDPPARPHRHRPVRRAGWRSVCGVRPRMERHPTPQMSRTPSSSSAAPGAP